MEGGDLEVLDEHVRALDEAEQELPGFGTTGVQRARQLVAGDGVVHRVTVVGPVGTPLPRRGVAGEQSAEHHLAVGAGLVALRRGREDRRVLDADHLRSQVGEQLRAVRPRPHGGQVDRP